MTDIEIEKDSIDEETEPGSLDGIELATVAAISQSGVTLIIDGDEEAGEKEYKVNTMQNLKAGDRVRISKISGTYLVEYVVGAPMNRYPIPAGGSDGQYLAKDGAGNYAVKWISPPTVHGIPAGGSTGHVLAKNTDNNYDVTWTAQPRGLPTGGSTGQVLAKSANGDYSVAWVDQPHGLPTGGTTGQYLRKSSNTNYAVEWAAAPSSDRLTSSAKHVIYDGSALYPDATSALGSTSYYWNGCYISGAIRLGNNAYNSTLGFFGTTPIAKKTNITTSSALSAVIQALKDYGLL